AETRFDAERILQDALFADLFASGPAHYPPIPSSVDDFSKISQVAAQAFAQRDFRQSNAVLSLAGDVDAQLLGSIKAGAQTGGAMDAPVDSTLASTPGSGTKSAFVTGLGYAWAGPPIADVKAATAMDFIADYLFDNDHGTLAHAIQKNNSDAFVNGQFITLHNPGVLLLTISGAASDALRTQVNDAVAAMQRPMDAKAFEAARQAFEYHLFSQMQTPMGRADNFGWYAAEGNASYAPGSPSGEYLKAAASLDPAYVAQTVRTYLQHPALEELISTQRKESST
ncbi:MAG TPA: hypothetical protein VIO32_05770, partial [Candidatus Baltobacteraceae bacterium]